MRDEIEKTIKFLAEKIQKDPFIKADDAMKYAQAALNLSHILVTLHNQNK